MKRALVIAAVAGCGSFEDPNVVIDIRALAMTADPPEQVVDVDLQDPPPPIDLLAQIVPTKVCALVADPNFDRRLRWSMRMCNLDNDARCPDDTTHTDIGAGLLDDPDLAVEPGPVAEPQMCATIQPDGNLVGIVLDIITNDTLHGLGGVYIGVSLRVGGEDGDPSLDLYAAKSLRVTPHIPATYTANHNPTISALNATVDGGLDGPITLGRCADQTNPLEVAPETKIRFTPIEPDGVRETYDAPTIDGGSRTFTEALTYQWIIGAGKLSKGSTGGPHDPFGNPAPLFTDWTAPKAADLDGPTDVPIWVVQRDERLGEAWFETCVRVVP